MSRHAPELASGSEVRLRVYLLGGFRVVVGERAIGESEWRLRKAAGLLKLLVLSPGHRLHRERVLELLWPDLEPGAATNNFHRTLHALRRILDPDRQANWLRLRDDVLTLAPPGRVWVDVRAFEAACATVCGAQDPAPYYAALELYTGELLPADRYEDWAASRREHLHDLYLHLLLQLARLHESRRELPAAIEALRRVVESEPAHEEAHTSLMRLYALSGQRHQALRQYGQLRNALLRELDAEPEVESQRLYREIRSGLFPPRASQYPTAPANGTETVARHNLPAPLTSFVAREQEVADVGRLLTTTRLLTLIGTGGCGKTRLALEVARGSVAAYADGVWLVELAGLSDPRLVPRAVADALGVREDPDRSLPDTLADALRSRSLLLVLDNCEHLLDACTLLAETLLSTCPYLRVLATSREALGARGELHWPVPSLSVPPAEPLSPVGRLNEYGSVRLFVERARFRQPAFELTRENARAVLDICRRLEGIPLAIELAAARVPTLSLEQIAARLDNSLGLLTGGGRLTAPRHKTLRGVFEWSHELLGEAERGLFAKLSVFAGGWELAAAEAVGAAHEREREEILDLLSHLVDKSLVLAEPGGGGTVRYRLLEPVRQYASERLEASREAETIRRRHALYFLALAERAEPELRGPSQVEWLDRLEANYADLRATFDWLLDNEPELALRLAVALTRFWWIRGYMVEGRRQLEAVLSRSELADPWLRARALHNAGITADAQGDKEWAFTFFELALGLFRQLGDRAKIASSLNSLGAVSRSVGDLVRARAFLEESLAIRRELGESAFICSTLGNLAQVERDCADRGRAQSLLEESLALNTEIGNEEGIAVSLIALGRVAWERGEHARARKMIEKGLLPARRVGDRELIAEGLEVLAAIGTPEDPRQAARLWGAAEQLREAVSAPVPPVDRPVHERMLAGARAGVDEETWRTGWSEGREMTSDQAVECALAVARGAQASPAEAPARTPQPLTRREQEIAVLIAQGLTNRQIAQRLVLSERTVDTHAGNIMRKLGLRTRAQVAAWAAGEGPLAGPHVKTTYT